jgi:DNA-binding transcriptional ArsR family regulator
MVNSGKMVNMGEPPEIREIDNVEELRALADPLRLAILATLGTDGPDGELAVMSVKELAQRLGEPQTKLYRHMKQLEAAGLIHVAATRMVSGILEQRYQARQRDLRLSAGLVRGHADEAEAAIRTAFDSFLEGLFDWARKNGWPEDAPDKPVMCVVENHVTPESAERIRARLEKVSGEISELTEPGDVPIRAVMGFYQQG